MNKDFQQDTRPEGAPDKTGTPQPQKKEDNENGCSTCKDAETKGSTEGVVTSKVGIRRSEKRVTFQIPSVNFRGWRSVHDRCVTAYYYDPTTIREYQIHLGGQETTQKPEDETVLGECMQHFDVWIGGVVY